MEQVPKFHFSIKKAKKRTLGHSPSLYALRYISFRTSWKGDGYCDDINNFVACEFDGGDCCGRVNKKYCIICECLESNNGRPGPPGRF